MFFYDKQNTLRCTTTILNRANKKFTLRTVIPTDKDTFKALKEDADIMKLYSKVMSAADTDKIYFGVYLYPALRKIVL